MSSSPRNDRAGKAHVLSVIIPVYNERDTVRDVVARVRAVNMPKEIILVDDGSTDGTREVLAELEPVVDRVVYHERNRGKGAAIRTGVEHVRGHMVIIQDADLEYDPAEYPRLVAPIVEGKADVVYGSRFMGGQPHRVHLYWHSVANMILTTLSNMVTNINLTDMETCFKVFRTEVIRNFDLRENGFGIEPEITAKVARMRCRIYEVGVSYYGRSYEEGKKIGLRDALWALVCILRYGLLQRLTRREVPAADGVPADAGPVENPAAEPPPGQGSSEPAGQPARPRRPAAPRERERREERTPEPQL